MSFRFHEPGPLIDRELELVTPDERWVDPILLACAHPLCPGDERADQMTRQALVNFLRYAPRGRQQGDGASRVPGYTFWMRLLPQYDMPIPMAGSISLRIGHSPEVDLYFGHIGYNVYPPARGRHYSERACRLLLPLAKAHGMDALWITCNPDNIASRRTCERLGAQFVETVVVPQSNVLYQRGEREKCRFKLEIG
jgi:predicted acetyltransferase